MKNRLIALVGILFLLVTASLFVNGKFGANIANGKAYSTIFLQPLGSPSKCGDAGQTACKDSSGKLYCNGPNLVINTQNICVSCGAYYQLACINQFGKPYCNDGAAPNQVGQNYFCDNVNAGTSCGSATYCIGYDATCNNRPNFFACTNSQNQVVCCADPSVPQCGKGLICSSPSASRTCSDSSTGLCKDESGNHVLWCCPKSGIVTPTPTPTPTATTAPLGKCKDVGDADTCIKKSDDDPNADIQAIGDCSDYGSDYECVYQLPK